MNRQRLSKPPETGGAVRAAPDLRQLGGAGERNVNIGIADRIARALGTTLAGMFPELERGPDDPVDK